MAEKKIVNKANAVRDYAKAHPGATSGEISAALAMVAYTHLHTRGATSGEISAALAKKGIVLTAIRVSVIKAKRIGWKTMVNEVATSRGVGLAEIKGALSLLALTGGVEGANRALMATKEVIAARGVASPEVKAASSLLEMTGGIEGANAALVAAQEIRAMA